MISHSCSVNGQNFDERCRTWQNLRRMSMLPSWHSKFLFDFQRVFGKGFIMPFVPSFHSKLPAARFFAISKTRTTVMSAEDQGIWGFWGNYFAEGVTSKWWALENGGFIFSTQQPVKGRHLLLLTWGSLQIGGGLSSVKRGNKCLTFCMSFGKTFAEPIPDGLNSNKRPRHGNDKCDPKNMCRENIKHLPAGSINDYHRQCQAALKDMSVSRKLFCLVSWLNIRQNIGYI